LRIRRRSLRKLLIAVGCIVANVDLQEASIGGLLLFGGSLVHLWSKGCLEQNRSLTTAGPYRWTRNPFYFANLLIDLGLCFVIGRVWVAALYLPIWWFSYRETIRREEQRLQVLFPETYPDYQASVPLLIPTGRGLSTAQAEGDFSWQNPALARGAEYARMVGVWLAPGIIWAAEILRVERLAVVDESNALSLGLIVLLPSAWVVKLALAETFRRPETAILPFGSRPIFRHCVSILLVAAAILEGHLWAVSLPALWIVLLLLDRLGRSRVGGAKRLERADWPYFRWIALVSITSYGVLAAMTRSVGG
jgi:hypothetical protein